MQAVRKDRLFYHVSTSDFSLSGGKGRQPTRPVCTGRQLVPSPRTASTRAARYDTAKFKLQFIAQMREMQNAEFKMQN